MNTAQLRRQVQAEINSARIVSKPKSKLSRFDRLVLKEMKSNVEGFKNIRIR